MMAKKLDSKELVTTEEISHSNMFQIEVIQRLLVEKGVIKQREYMEEMKGPVRRKGCEIKREER